MTVYTTVSGISQLLDTTQWESEELHEQIITASPSVRIWIDTHVGRTTGFTESDLLEEPVIVLAANCYCTYMLLSTQLDGHRVEEYSLALRRLEDAKDYVRTYCYRNGIVPVFDVTNTVISGTINYAFANGTDVSCI